MLNTVWARMGPFAASAMLMIGAGLKYPSEYSTALMAAGLVVFGAWLAVEIAAIIDIHYDKHGPSDGEGDGR